MNSRIDMDVIVITFVVSILSNGTTLFTVSDDVTGFTLSFIEA